MSSGTQKPPLAPKPKIPAAHPQRPGGGSPSAPKRDGISPGSPAAPKRVKPALAPKPCLLKLAGESTPLARKAVHQTAAQEETENSRTIEKSENSRTLGLRNSRNGIQQENRKKPDWDYIIPICLCSLESCVCSGNTNAQDRGTDRTTAQDRGTDRTNALDRGTDRTNAQDRGTDRTEKDLKTSHRGRAEERTTKPVPRSRARLDDRADGAESPNVSPVPQAGGQVPLQRTPSNGTPPVCDKPETLDGLNLNSNDAEPPRPEEPTPALLLRHRTRSDPEANGNLAAPPAAAAAGSECAVSVETTGASSHQPRPVPVPRKPRKAAAAAVTRQGGGGAGAGAAGEEKGEATVWEEVRVRGSEEERKLRPSLSVDASPAALGRGVATGNERPASSRPAPPPKKKTAYRCGCEATGDPSSPSPSPSADPRPPSPNVEEEELGVEEEELAWDDHGVYEMECSVDEDDAEEEEGREEAVDEDDLAPCMLPVAVATGGGVSEEGDGVLKMAAAPEKPPRRSGREGRKTTGDEGGGGRKTIQDGGVKESALRGLPAAPGGEVPSRRSVHQTPASRIDDKPDRDRTGNRPSPLSSATKPRAKSFSAADLLVRSEGQKRGSFRKLLDLKLTVKMLPRRLVRGGGGASQESAAAAAAAAAAETTEQCVDGDRDHDDGGGGVGAGPGPGWWGGGERGFSSRPPPPQTQTWTEQNVDGDELFYPGAERGTVEYENAPLYEEIAEYENLVPGTGTISSTSTSTSTMSSTASATMATPPAWQDCMYDDENIYEEQEPYMPLEKDLEQQQHTDTERSSVDEEVALLDDGPSDDDMVHSSDEEEEDEEEEEEEEEDDDSSSSSKGYPELSGESEADRGPKKSKIAHIATEIMSSERVFVNVLKLLHIDFREAVTRASGPGGKPVVEERILNQILYSLPQLYQLNQDLLRELEGRVAQWDEHARLADIFVQKGPYLKMYSTYIREFDRNVALLDEQSKRNPAFAGVVREFEASPCCASLALKHYLLKPVQRIPQYQMLLTDYLKNLPSDSDDYKDTQAALGIVKEVANHANDIMKQGDNFQKLIQLQCSLNGNHEIVQPGRVFLKEGVLMKLSRKVMQPRTFFLFNDTLLYTTPVQSGQFKLNNMLSLAGMKVSKPSQEAYQNELNIESVERSFILSASSATERDDWLAAISTAISDHTRKKITFISSKSLEETEPLRGDTGAPLGSKAPIWIPDLRATMCLICTCEFTLTWRRHHCRACGKVVCQACSSNKHSLEYLKNRLARVCDRCIVVLQQQRSEHALSTALSPGGKPSFAFSRKTKKIPAALKEVSANTDNSSMSGYLQRSKGNRKQGKRLWFVIKNKVLYTYAASEDVAALESQPLLGFLLEEDAGQKLQFKLFHKNTLYYIFKTDEVPSAQRWIDAFKEATVL